MHCQHTRRHIMNRTEWDRDRERVRERARHTLLHWWPISPGVRVVAFPFSFFEFLIFPTVNATVLPAVAAAEAASSLSLSSSSSLHVAVAAAARRRMNSHVCTLARLPRNWYAKTQAEQAKASFQFRHTHTHFHILLSLPHTHTHSVFTLRLSCSLKSARNLLFMLTQSSYGEAATVAEAEAAADLCLLLCEAPPLTRRTLDAFP